jgi:hypothetical protein
VEIIALSLSRRRALRHSTNTLATRDSSVYARTTIASDKERKATLRLTCDDWAVVWVNGEKIATLDHAKEMATVRLPILLKQGGNDIDVFIAKLTPNTSMRSTTRDMQWEKTGCSAAFPLMTMPTLIARMPGQG